MKETVNIHGKQYETVASRLHRFREHTKGKGFGIVTEVLGADESVVLVKASIVDGDGRVVATGHGEEFRAASKINKTSAVENAETSAVGRALAMLGYAGTELASADEMHKAKRTTQANGDTWT